MSAPVFLVDLVNPRCDQIITVTGAEGHHGAKVKRLRLGEQVVLADGAGLGVSGLVTAVGKNDFSVLVTQVLQDETHKIQWVGIQALAKGSRSQIAVEALTELGVDRLIAWQAERSIVRWDGKIASGIARWESVSMAAAKQSRRLSLPKVSYATTDDVTKLIRDLDLVLVCHEEADEWLTDVELPSSGTVGFIVGPEGGISPTELSTFVDAGAKPVRLVPEVLRASTAGLVALSQLRLLAD